MKLRISVTKETLEKTKDCSDKAGENCAIAYEIRKIFPNAWVERTNIIFNYEEYFIKRISNKKLSSPLPIEAKTFIMNFDAASPHLRTLMPPISFEIDVPKEVIEQVDIEEIKNILTLTPTLELYE